MPRPRDLRCLESKQPYSVTPKHNEDITRGQRDSKLTIDPIGQGELSYLEIHIVAMTIEPTSNLSKIHK